jgi:membrane associated rhomboid family serine protease
MCPNCRAFITMSDRVCPYCEAQLGPRAVDLRPNQYLSAFMPRANTSAIVVLVVNIVFYLGQVLSHGALTDAGREVAEYVVFDHQWWRLITAGFLHGGILHIAMNSWSLWILVTETEHFYGTARLAVAYVVSTITGFALTAVLSPEAPVLGASCAAFGLIGTMLAIGFRNRADPLSQAVRSQYGTWFVYGIVMSFLPGISWQGHLGGFLGGLLVGFVAGLPGLPRSPREAFWKFAGIASVLLVGLAWFEALTHPLPMIQP